MGDQWRYANGSPRSFPSVSFFFSFLSYMKRKENPEAEATRDG
jgi:hypothetical protein